MNQPQDNGIEAVTQQADAVPADPTVCGTCKRPAHLGRCADADAARSRWLCARFAQTKSSASRRILDDLGLEEADECDDLATIVDSAMATADTMARATDLIRLLAALAAPHEAETQPSADRVSSANGYGCVKPDTDKQVFFYEQDFYVLSNFSAFNLVWRRNVFPTSEHAYHWEKFGKYDNGEGVEMEPMYDLREDIRTAPSAHEAFKLAEQHKADRRPDWDAVKVDLMRDILRAKADQHEYVRRKLLASGDRELIEDSWRDDFWGWGPNRDGKNMLGKLWMEIRSDLRAAFAAPSQPSVHPSAHPGGEGAPITQAVVESAWQPIETAPNDGRGLLLGHFNSRGKWRMVRGAWCSADDIAETWEEEADEGWYEMSVEADDPPNCWRTEPTHWMPLPPPPKEAGELLVHPSALSGSGDILGGNAVVVTHCNPYAGMTDEQLDAAFTAEDPRYPARKAAAEALHAYTNKWIEDYEFDDGESRPHSPSEFERFLILDAFYGLTADDEYMRLKSAWHSLRGPRTAPPESAQAVVDADKGVA